MKDYFQKLVDWTLGLREGDEVFLLQYQGENSEFCRFNQARVRQSGHVSDHRLRFRLVRGKRHSAYDLTLTMQEAEDQGRLRTALRSLRGIVDQLPDDPYLDYNQQPHSSEHIKEGRLPDLQEWSDDIREAMAGLDVAGIYASGPVYQGFANSLGQLNWFESRSFHFDWSVYLHSDKAVKASYADFSWDRRVLQSKMEECRRELDYLKLPEQSLKPGEYRVYLAPSALAEVFGLLQWRGFGLKSQRTKASPLMHLIEGKQRFSPSVTLTEDAWGAVSPHFDAFGFTRPKAIPLVEQGQFAGSLISARSAAEYSVPSTGACENENPESLSMQTGLLKKENLFGDIGDGLWINNLWYMNFSDAFTGRMTGMSRFACFRVKNGKIQGPINAMRFDESLYRMFGDQLIGLTEDAEWILSSSTYDRRSTESLRLPGALIDRFTFTL